MVLPEGNSFSFSEKQLWFSEVSSWLLFFKRVGWGADMFLLVCEKVWFIFI